MSVLTTAKNKRKMIPSVQSHNAQLPGLALVPSKERALEHGALDLYIHPTALVDTEEIGAGTRIWAFTHVSTDVVIGSDCNIGSHCYIESGVNVGNAVTIKNGNNLWSGVTICDGAFIGPQVVFTNDLHPRSPRLPQVSDRYQSSEWLVPTQVGEGASIGGGAVILAGVSLGRFCMIGAGSVVTKAVPAHALVMGVPARHSGWVCCCGTKLNFERAAGAVTSCSVCSRQFEWVDGALRIRS